MARQSQNRSEDSTQPKYLLLGEVLRPHGIRGELRMRILTDYPERITDLETIYIGKDPYEANAAAYRVEHMRLHQAYGLLKLATIDDRTQAEPFRELFVMVDIADAVPLEEDEFYLYQLIGLKVETEAGEFLGEIQDVLETGANDVYVVKGEAYGEVLIPVTDETIVKTDIEAGVMVVNLPDGLLPQKSRPKAKRTKGQKEV
jgi:16S rRNA processing protein RimM